MPLPNAQWPNTSRPNSPPASTSSLSQNIDVKIDVYEAYSESNDVRLDIAVYGTAYCDTILRIVEVLSEYTDVKMDIAEPRSEYVDIELRVFNPLPMSDNFDILMQTWPSGGVAYSENSDMFLRVVEAISENNDLLLKLVEEISENADVRMDISQTQQEMIDVIIRIHTDVTATSVTNIAKMYERRFLPYFSENVMFKPGSATQRYLLFHAFATAEMNARQKLEDTLLNMRLLQAHRAALDYVGDRVGERRWQFYENITDRFESDENYRARLLPYFLQRRGTLEALEEAVEPLHNSYGGMSAFFSYRVGDGWLLGDSSRSLMARSTFLGGPLLDFNPLEYLRDTDLWVLGTGTHTITGPILPQAGRTRVMGDGFNNKFAEELKEGMYLYVATMGGDVYIGQIAEIIDNNNLELVAPSTTGTGTAWYTAKAKLPDGDTSPGSGNHSTLGYETYLGDRERLSPFTFLVLVTNFPEVETWRRLYLHTIDRFKAAGTVPIVVFRRASMLQQQYLAGDGTSDYTIPNEHLQGENVIVFVANAHQEPDNYSLVNSGNDTILSFSENVELGWSIWVYWVENPT